MIFEKFTHNKEKKTDNNKESATGFNPENAPRKSATPIFWLCAIFGGLGVHCFWTGRRARGVQYLLWGGSVFAIAYTAFYANDSIIPPWFAILGMIAACWVQILVIMDLWKISLGKYRSRKTGRRYRATPIWMVPIAAIMTALTIYSYTEVATFMTDNVVKKGRPIAAKMELEVEAYMIAQQNYFDKNGKIGNFDEIGFLSANTNSSYFMYENEANELKVTYMTTLNCPSNTTWLVKPNIVNNTLTWKITLPQDADCNAMAPQMVKLEKEMRALADSAAASAAKLDESVDGVGVVPDTTQQRDSL